MKCNQQCNFHVITKLTNVRTSSNSADAVANLKLRKTNLQDFIHKIYVLFGFFFIDGTEIEGETNKFICLFVIGKLFLLFIFFFEKEFKLQKTHLFEINVI